MASTSTSGGASPPEEGPWSVPCSVNTLSSQAACSGVCARLPTGEVRTSRSLPRYLQLSQHGCLRGQVSLGIPTQGDPRGLCSPHVGPSSLGSLCRH